MSSEGIVEYHIMERLEKWGAGSLSSEEIKELRNKCGNRADELLKYYSN